MSFTPETSLDSMSRLGRKTGLLERNRLENGNTLFGKVLSFINSKKEKGGLLTILGHPSAGKTTEFNRIARALSSNESFANEFLPLFTELQNAELAGVEFDEQFIWQGIVSGSIDVEIHGEKPSESLESFCNYSRELNRSPILLIDTLDILMLHQVNEKEVEVAKLWADFLQTIIDNNVTLVWTCRPFEWKYFQGEIESKYETDIEVEILPNLSKEQLNPFTAISELISLGDVEKHNSHKDSLHDPSIDLFDLEELSSQKDWPEQDAWDKWTTNFQAHMPIFADRWSDKTKKSKRLDDNLFSEFAADFRAYTSSNLHNKHWYEFIKQLPSQYLYSWLWNRISRRMEDSYNLSSKDVQNMRNVLEKEAKNTALNRSGNSSRVRLEYAKIVDSIIENCHLDEVSVSQLFVVCESRGLLERNGIWVDFAHQLLFEEALLRQSDDDEIEQLQKFPSILLRTKTDVRSFSKSDEILRDEVLNAIGNWTGYQLSYHPSCISKNSNLNATWEKWINYSQQNISLQVPRLEFNEHTEKRIALKKYQQSDGKKALIVNGAPGTGKTYFCRDYLKWVLSNSSDRSSTSKTKLKWRYYTMNGHLANHFDLLVDDFADLDPDMKSDLSNTTGGSFAIGRLLRFINPEIKLDKKWSEGYGGLGLLTFSVFKQLIRSYFSQKSVRFSGVKCPPLADAWLLYNEVIHDSITGERIVDLDRKRFKELNTQSYRMNAKTIDWFLKFHKEVLAEYWWTYDYASFDCRNKLNSLTSLRHEQYEIDVLIVDEVQDISPPVMALLLELMRPGFSTHSIMIAGDMIQTVNRSGFHWIDFSQKTAKSLQNSIHPDKWKLIDFGVIDKNELVTHRSTLKYVWRNGKKLVEFNNKMRKDFASGFGIEELYSSNFDYPGGELLISQASLDKDKDSKITVIECDHSITEYNKLLAELAESTKKLIGEDVAILAPFEIEEKWNEEFLIPVYDAESVKGLEFDSIVVLMPYLLPEDEARSSLIRQLGESDGEIQNQIQKWCDSWKEQRGDASQKNFENFNQLFLNVMTRMNVLFSRPEKRILIINPVRFGERVQVFERDESAGKMMSFGIPKLPKNIGIRRNESMFSTLTVPIKMDKYQTNIISYLKLLPKAINQATLNNDGTQVDNERKVWDNLWVNVNESRDAPLNAIAYAGGLKHESNNDIFRLLRSDLGRAFQLDNKSLPDPENQFIYAISKGYIEDGNLLFEPHMAHYIFSNLESIIRKIMSGTEVHRRLHDFMMMRLFGIDVSEIPNYDFEHFIKQYISKNSLSLKTFSEGIISSNLPFGMPFFNIKTRTNEYREKIVRHIHSRVEQGLESPVKTRPEWVDESKSLWGDINQFVNEGNFDSDFVNDVDYSTLIEWITRMFEIGKTPHGQVASNLVSWREVIDGGKASPLHRTAWDILNKVIPKLHENRNNFSIGDYFYLKVYDALRLDLDMNGLKLFHEILELSLENLLSGDTNNFEDSFRKVIEYNSKRLLSSRQILVNNMSDLGRYWLTRSVNRKTHKFNPSRGASVVGAMIHVAYLNQPNNKQSLIRKQSIIRELEKQLHRYFESTISLHINSKDYWLKYNLQNPTFRNILARIIDVDKATLTAQLDGPPSEFLSKLLMLDFVSMTDSNWDSANRRDPSTKQMVPDFSSSKLDSLTEQIVTTFTSIKTIPGRFFKTYIDDLSGFLDSAFVYRKRKSSDYLSIEELVENSPGEWINREMWITWEWFLHLCSVFPDLDRTWNNVQNNKLLTQGLSKRFNLHKYLRINHGEKSSTIYDEIYDAQFSLIQEFANEKLSDFERKKKMKLGHILLDFTEFIPRSKRSKSFKFNQWQSLQRLIFSNSDENAGVPQSFVDWEICYHLWRLLNPRGIQLDNEEFVQTVGKILEVLQSGLLKYIDQRIPEIDYAISRGNDLEKSLFTFSDLLDYDDSGKKSEIKSILESIITVNNSYNDVIGHQKGLKMARIENSIFGNGPEMEDVRTNIAERLVNYLMSELISLQKKSDGVTFTKTDFFSGTKVRIKNKVLDEINALYVLDFK